jgi:transcriptional regulator with XRE-family HTH domain
MRMELHIVRGQVAEILTSRQMTQEAFARKHNLSSSWFNKFLLGKVKNPQFRSLKRIEKALEAEARTG